MPRHQYTLLGFGQRHQLLRFLPMQAQRLFAQHMLVGFQRRLDQLIVHPRWRRHDHRVNLRRFQHLPVVLEPLHLRMLLPDGVQPFRIQIRTSHNARVTKL